MQTLTEEQVLQRWDTLPDNLRGLLVSPETSDVVQNICDDQKLSEENLLVVLSATADVLMGFTHPDDVASELIEQIKLDPKIAATIQEGLKVKIFTSLKQTLDVVYKLADATTIKTPIAPTNIDAPKMFDVATLKATAPLPPPAPKTDFSGKGWSGMQAVAGPQTIKTDTATRPASFTNIPKPAPMPSVMTSAPMPTPAPKPISNIVSQPQNIPPIPKASPIEVAPAPMMVKGTNFNSAPQKNADFHLSQSGSGAQVTFDQTKPQAKILPAFIEFSKPTPTLSASSTPVLPPIAPTSALVTPKGAIHYSDFTPSTGPRSVTEITSAPNTQVAPTIIPSIPKPPVAPKPMISSMPTPPQPPKPPVQVIKPITPTSMPIPAPVAPPAPQLPQPPQPPKPAQVRVITKDFL
jgi:hypothetical protein